MRKAICLAGVAFVCGLNAALALDAAPAPRRIESIAVEGTAFKVGLSDGRSITGRDLEGATLTLSLPDRDGPARVRLDRIVAAPDDGDLLLYEMSVFDPGTGGWDALCEADKEGARWSFPLSGQWSEGGERLGDGGVTLACAAGGAIGKCVRWGYQPWKTLADGTSLAPYHAACVHMVRADYCGDRGTTRDGMPIDVFDDRGVIAPDDVGAAAANLTFEAAWTPDGALCVAQTRVPKNMTLEGLKETCPRLEGRLGPAKCTEDAAKRGAYGEAILFSRTRPDQ